MRHGPFFEIASWLHVVEDAVHAGLFVPGGQVLTIPTAQYQKRCHCLVNVFELIFTLL